MEGTAARVLDYAATWVHDDGSSEMLEHEIQKIQSQEAINSESEMQPPTGLVLHLRVIKPDGRVLEPEPVAGKPTVTLPHLEVGDFIEMEHITPEAGDGAKGRQYHSPHWFFREADKGYWRSEFVVVTPASRELEIETRGNVPAAAGEERRDVRRAPLARGPEPAGGGRGGEPAHHRVLAERARRLGHLARVDAGAPRRPRGRRHAARSAPPRAGARGRARRAGDGDRRARAPRLPVGARARAGRQGDRRPPRHHGRHGLAPGGVPLHAAAARDRQPAGAREEPAGDAAARAR